MVPWSGFAPPLATGNIARLVIGFRLIDKKTLLVLEIVEIEIKINYFDFLDIN